MNSTHKTTGDIFNISGVNSYSPIKYIEGFTPFCIDEGEEALFSFVEGTKVPKMKLALYEFTHEGDKGFLPTLKQQGVEAIQPRNSHSIRFSPIKITHHATYRKPI